MQHTSLDWSGVVHYLVGLESSGRPSGDDILAAATNGSVNSLVYQLFYELADVR